MKLISYSTDLHGGQWILDHRSLSQNTIRMPRWSQLTVSLLSDVQPPCPHNLSPQPLYSLLVELSNLHTNYLLYSFISPTSLNIYLPSSACFSLSYLLLLRPHTYLFSSTLLHTLLPSLLFGLPNLHAHSPSLFFQMANLTVHSPALLSFLLVILPYSPCKPAASHIPYLLNLLTNPLSFSPIRAAQPPCSSQISTPLLQPFFACCVDKRHNRTARPNNQV